MEQHYINKMNDKYKEAKILFLQGLSLSEIERRTSFNRKRLSSLLKHEGYSIKKNNQKYNYNDKVFEKIDTEEKAYWLGFLYADGNIRVIGQKALVVSLSAKDEVHLEKFKNFISPDHKISKEKVFLETTSKTYNSVRLSITNSKIVDDLIAHGCVPEKTFILSFPKLQDNLIKHFIRGYFDGDGTAAKINGKSCFGILGASKNFISEIEKHLNQYAKVSKKNIAERNRIGRNTLYEFRYGAQVDIIKIYHYLYDDATVYLERKHALLKERL